MLRQHMSPPLTPALSPSEERWGEGAWTAPCRAPWQRDVRDFALGPSLGQCCGGYTRLLFEVFTGRERPTLEALARVADPRCHAGAAAAGQRASARSRIEPQGAGRAAARRHARRARHAVGRQAARGRADPRRQGRQRLVRRAAGAAHWCLSSSTARATSAARWCACCRTCRSRSPGPTPRPARFPDPLPAACARAGDARPAGACVRRPGRRLPHRHDLLARPRSGDLPCRAAARRFRPSRPDRLGDQAGALPQAAGRARHRPGDARAPDLPDRPARARRQGARHDRRLGRRPAGAARNRRPRGDGRRPARGARTVADDRAAARAARHHQALSRRGRQRRRDASPSAPRRSTRCWARTAPASRRWSR